MEKTFSEVGCSCPELFIQFLCINCIIFLPLIPFQAVPQLIKDSLCPALEIV